MLRVRWWLVYDPSEMLILVGSTRPAKIEAARAAIAAIALVDERFRQTTIRAVASSWSSSH
jgi:hypothetical protein